MTKGKAVDLGGNGYPSRYTARAEDVLPEIVAGPPLAHVRWTKDAHDVVDSRWIGKTAIDTAVVERCRADEWLLIEAWDES